MSATMLAYLFGPLLLIASGLILAGYNQILTGGCLVILGVTWLVERADRGGKRA